MRTRSPRSRCTAYQSTSSGQRRPSAVTPCRRRAWGRSSLGSKASNPHASGEGGGSRAGHASQIREKRSGDMGRTSWVMFQDVRRDRAARRSAHPRRRLERRRPGSGHRGQILDTRRNKARGHARWEKSAISSARSSWLTMRRGIVVRFMWPCSAARSPSPNSSSISACWAPTGCAAWWWDIGRAAVPETSWRWPGGRVFPWSSSMATTRAPTCCERSSGRWTPGGCRLCSCPSAPAPRDDRQRRCSAARSRSPSGRGGSCSSPRMPAPSSATTTDRT
jgi:hypothetical protein